MRVLHGHTSPETAHLTFAYPFGSNRCVRREWIEHGTKGAGKGQYRFVYQTTDRPFNYAYTERIERDGQEAADAWATTEILAGRVHMNAPKAGTYSVLLIMIEEPLEDGSGRLGIKNDGLGLGAGADSFERFRALYGKHLDETETKRVNALESLSRRMSPIHWAEHDAKNAA